MMYGIISVFFIRLSYYYEINVVKGLHQSVTIPISSKYYIFIYNF